ncbi:hypothetical protein [Ructibacterium gallinarum]|uniref:Uncharacterized protein n=1 Tax=Ructibacterium gallinarum TaxID=2779355 RepID=A0A9D5M2W3_9FIRM|nr:hypothetical protein [Ructibacterium gallinarum]MBE5040508.1 hypothetical protein [Ructibacterium gallinarum]
MIFNLIHRCDDTPMYEFQRECAHRLNLRTTIFLRDEFFENSEVIDKVKEDCEVYGSEAGIWLEPIEGQPATMFWLLNTEQKRENIKTVVEKYKKIFGRYPKVMGNYVLDAVSIQLIKEICPEVTTVVAGCFEEGVKVFHGCNNSWYLFSEGMSWNPWYPSKTQSIRPAKNEEDWSGVVAVPHLSRDLALGYEQRNDFFASHPANVQRGLANLGAEHPYDFNLVDQYRMQEDFNDGFSYYQIHVGSNWLCRNHNIIDSEEISRQLYSETLEYIAKLVSEGKVESMTLSELGSRYKECFPLDKQTIGVGKDILYGSGKHFFWVFDGNYRALIDTFQGGSIGDLRPFCGEYASFTGTDSKSLDMNSYPYVIQSQYRTGYKNHYEDGARTTLMVEHGEETLDLCAYRTEIKDVERNENESILKLTPVKLTFADGAYVEIETRYLFKKHGNIMIVRAITDKSDGDCFKFTEYLKGCYGFTEYPENMYGIELMLDGEKAADYNYSGKEYEKNGSKTGVKIGQINTEILLEADCGVPEKVSVQDGHLFSPFYTLRICYAVGNETEEIRTWLIMKKTIM